MNRTYIQKSKKGFSLLELLLVLGIIAALIVAAFIVFPKVKNSVLVSKQSQQIALLLAGIEGMYSSQSSYNGLDNQTIINAKIATPEMIRGTQLINVWKGNLTVKSVDNGFGTNRNYFSIALNNIPKDVCAPLFLQLYKSFDVAAVGNIVIYRSTLLTRGNEVKLDMKYLNQHCSEASFGNSLNFSKL